MTFYFDLAIGHFFFCLFTFYVKIYLDIVQAQLPRESFAWCGKDRRATLELIEVYALVERRVKEELYSDVWLFLWGRIKNSPYAPNL